jgi:ribosomal protein S18 acetylase RimI-like enzyme
MEIRPMTADDTDSFADVDGTIESLGYLHIEAAGTGMAKSWRLEPRAFREKRITPNPPDEECCFLVRQIATGMDDGLALLAEHETVPAAAMIAQITRGVMRLVDLRVDYDFRRQGIGSALIYQLIQVARERGLRAVMTIAWTDNLPSLEFLNKAGFELSGLDLRVRSNHDLVKETVALFWYLPLD